MRNIKFSILIPVYNVEKYLSQCINSVLSQNYNNIEVILIDDGSTDNSGKICDEYAQMDNRIKVIHKDNEGLLLARRTAVKVASGDYFMFLDSDDYWDSDLLNSAHDIIQRYNCDMVLFNYKHVYPDKVLDNIPLFDNESIFEGNKKNEIYKYALESGSVNNLCLKIVSRNIIDFDFDYKIFKDVAKGEDVLQSAPLLIAANKIVYMSKSFYNYRRTTGMTQTIKSKDLLSITKARQAIIKLYAEAEKELSNSISINYDTYMMKLSKYILYGYIDNQNDFKRKFKDVRNTEYYKNAKSNSFSKLSNFNKFIIRVAEDEKYFIIKLSSYILKLRNYIKNN